MCFVTSYIDVDVDVVIDGVIDVGFVFVCVVNSIGGVIV